MFDLPRKRIALSLLISGAFFSLSDADAKFEDELYYHDKGVTSESRSIAKIEKLRPLIYLEKD